MSSTGVVVSTGSGQVRGAQDPAGGAVRFLGVPYAEAPVGENRFRPTVPVRPWQGVRDALTFGHASAQVFDPHEAPYEEFVDDPAETAPVWVGSEDSLTLNIWTPAADAGKRPVLVWIHGGANWLESSRLSAYHGDRFVARGDVVFVSLNYRLGVFGFLDLSVVGGDPYAGSHSNGLRDQMTALEWIKANIAAFGGDPGNITLMGESAGSIDISWHMTTGRLDGLVRRVVMMSGVGGARGFGHDHARSGHSEAVGRERAQEFLSRIGVKTIADLQALSTAQILERQAAVAAEESILFYMDSLFYPRVDNRYTTIDPFRAARDGLGRNLDLLIGYTGYEMGLWLAWDNELDRRPPQWAAENLGNFPDHLRRPLAELYETVCAEDPPGVQTMHLLGDAIFAMPSALIADKWVEHNPNVWMYQFDWEADPRKRALHAADQVFLFDKTDSRMGVDLIGAARSEADRAARHALSASFQDAVIAFARGHAPSSPGLPAWPRYGAGERNVMRLDTASRVERDPLAPRRTWWRREVYDPVL